VTARAPDPVAAPYSEGRLPKTRHIESETRAARRIVVSPHHILIRLTESRSGADSIDSWNLNARPIFFDPKARRKVHPAIMFRCDGPVAKNTQGTRKTT